TRGLIRLRASAAPMLEPIPNPTRKMARMIEKVYVVAPSVSDSNRVQTTSADMAVMPERAITRWAIRQPCAAATCGAMAPAFRLNGQSADSASAETATTTLTVTATNVATTMS